MGAGWETTLVVCRLLLVGVFVVAGLTKLSDRVGTRTMFVEFGLPAALAKPLSVVLPVVEVAVAALLVPTISVVVGAAAAVVLLGAFLLLTVLTVARGHQADCRCFGQAHSSPVGGRTVVRNGALLAVAGVVLWGARDGSVPSATGWWTAMSGAQRLGLVAGIVVAGLAVVGTWIVLNLLSQQGRLLLKVEAIERDLSEARGAAAPPVPPVPVAPDFTLPGLDGRAVTLGDLWALGSPLLLVFTDPKCVSCRALLPDVVAWQRDYGDRLTVVPISRGPAAANRAWASAAGLSMLLLQEDHEVETAYGVDATPSAVGITPTGFLASPVVAGTDGIRALMDRVIAALQAQARAETSVGHGHGAHHHDHGGVTAETSMAQ